LTAFLQGVKDYADQQKRLQKDISTLLERNRDLMHKREEEQRQIEIKNQENARKLQEAACDISLEESHDYIPSGDGIHRPKLLFLPLTPICPEHELDSPELGGKFILEASPPVQTIQLAPPAGSDLLSPQYCPNPKATAKKIFSVTRVTSPTGLTTKGGDPSSGFKFPKFSSSAADVINSPTQVHPPVGRGMDTSTSQVIPQLVPPLPTVDLPSLNTAIPLSVDMHTTADKTSPGSLQRVIEDQTLVSYIQQIVDNNVETGNTKIDNVSDQSNAESNLEKEPVEDEHSANNNASGETGHEFSKIVVTVDTESLDKTANDSARKSEYQCNECTENCTDGNEVEMNENDQLAKRNTEKALTEEEGKSGKDFIGEESVTSNSKKCDKLPEENIPDAEDIENSVLKKDIKYQKKTQHIDFDESDVKSECDTCSKTTVGGDSTGSSQDVELSKYKCDSEVVQRSDLKSLSELDMPSLSNDSCDVEINKDDDINGEFVDCVATEDNVCDTETDKNVVKGNQEKRNWTDKENGDAEPWNTVNESDIVESMSSIEDTSLIGSNNKPDFHTNLTFNGLRQELASLIDEEAGSSSGNQLTTANGDILNNGGNTETYTQNGE
jgi:hypothetical protein